MKLLNVGDVAQTLDVDEQTIRRWYRDGVIPNAFRVGLKWRISEKDFHKWISFKQNPALFIEKEIKALRKSPEYLDETDEGSRMALEAALRSNWDIKPPKAPVAANFDMFKEAK